MKTEVLDHGYAKLIESWGSDQHIVEAARMSTDKGFKGWGPEVERNYKGQQHTLKCTSWEKEGTPDYAGSCDCDPSPGDEKLLGYLWRNKHATPFEMAGLTVEIQAPILVFRQWHRHRTQSYNEMSARYTPLPDVNYVPSVERLMVGANKNKQAGTAKGSKELTIGAAELWQKAVIAQYKSQEAFYRDALAMGVPKELARAHVGVGRYSRMRASANLRNWLAFMTLRCDAHAQYEIRVYADAISGFIAERFPRTHKLWSEGR